ncbi:TnsA-like heteromeric transposase endonuclease subunit [Kibdelosporangium aridum]|uniref:TnsA-like heteromeric transposase endonuclease subunit n=1 Tax=Kibdelosporangium aridum TaxID=2030 RepID=UPI0005265F1E
MAVAVDIPTSMTVSYRCANSLSGKASEGTSERTEPWALVGLDSVMSASPWRTFRWYRGQRHYSGSFWSATERDLVIYESRLELARLLFADFDRSVQRILPQPFLLSGEVAGALRKHVPDYLLLTRTGPLVVDVKPRQRATKPDNMFVFGWTRLAVESRGWRYEVWSEPPHAELENVRFLAGYRRDWLFDQELLAELRAADLDGTTLAAACQSLPDQSRATVRSAVLHLLWQQHFTADLTRTLSGNHVLRKTT